MQVMIKGRMEAGIRENRNSTAQARNLPKARPNGPVGAVMMRRSVCETLSPAKLLMVMSGSRNAQEEHMPFNSVPAAPPSREERKIWRQA